METDITEIGNWIGHDSAIYIYTLKNWRSCLKLPCDGPTIGVAIVSHYAASIRTTLWQPWLYTMAHHRVLMWYTYHMSYLALTHDFAIEATFIAGKENDLADSISRLYMLGQIDRMFTCLANWHKPHTPPAGYWLHRHMSVKSMITLYHLIQKWCENMNVSVGLAPTLP
jgi:hypothetical protein